MVSIVNKFYGHSPNLIILSQTTVSGNVQKLVNRDVPRGFTISIGYPFWGRGWVAKEIKRYVHVG